MIQFAHIKQSTQRNDHNTALHYGLGILSLDEKTRSEKIEELADIMRQHHRAGHMTLELMERRRVVYDFVMDEAKKQFNEETFKAFHACF